jgi:glycosyltransferase involved in cell wall biosynthesis
MKSDSLCQQAPHQANTGLDQAALTQAQTLLKECPNNGAAWDEAGEILYAQGRFDEAIHYFRRAIDSEACPVRAYRHLVRAYLAAGQPWQAMRWFETLCLEGLLDETLVHEIADGFIAQNDLASAMEALYRGRRALPDAVKLDARITALRSRRPKIAFFIGGDGANFLNDILDFACQRYEVRVFESGTEKQLADLMRWSDISWFEWCTNLAQIGTALPKVCRTIIRLHRYEAYEPWPTQINWKAVDALVTVGNPWVHKALEHWRPDIRKRVSIVNIPNGVNLEAYPYTSRRPGKNIAFIGALRMVKNPMLLFQCMAALKKIDPQYRLFIAGRVKELVMQHYYEHTLSTMGLQDVIVYDGFQDDIPRWLADKQYLVSTSVIEGCPMGILEAMATGVKPIIAHFPGAEALFDRDYLFTTPEEFCRRIVEPQYDSQRYRDFVERRYPLSAQLLRINELFAMFEKNPWTEKTSQQTAEFSGLTALTV